MSPTTQIRAGGGDPLKPIVDRLKDQGYILDGPEDLVPTMLGERGYVGCRLPQLRGSEIVPRNVWIRSPDVARTQAFREGAAEFLTKLLIRRPVPVERVIELYEKAGLATGPSRLEALSALSQAAENIGCTGLPDGLLQLPEDHPWLEDGCSSLQPQH